MENCIFCRIIRGDVPSYRVYEDEHVLAILDKMQAVYGHTVVFPKTHHADLFVTPPDELMHTIMGAKHAAEILKKRLGCTGVNILSANGKDAQQSVFHLHLHVIPRWDHDGVDAWPKFDYKNPDKDEIYKKITGA